MAKAMVQQARMLVHFWHGGKHSGMQGNLLVAAAAVRQLAMLRCLSTLILRLLVWVYGTPSYPAYAIIIIIMLPNQAIASTPSAPRPSGAEGRGSTAPLRLQLLPMQ
jgi:hypothetical protein